MHRFTLMVGVLALVACNGDTPPEDAVAAIDASWP